MKICLISVFCLMSISAVSSQHEMIIDRLDEEFKNLTLEMKMLREESDDTQEKLEKVFQDFATKYDMEKAIKSSTMDFATKDDIEKAIRSSTMNGIVLHGPGHFTAERYRVVPRAPKEFDPERPSPGRWEKWTGTVPTGAVPGGEGPNGKVYIGLVFHQSGLITGTVEDGVCRVTYGGCVIEKTDFYILTNSGQQKLSWKPMNGEKVPSGAILGGIDSKNDIYIARIFFDKVPVIGKLVPWYFTSYFAKDGQEKPQFMKDSMILCHE